MQIIDFTAAHIEQAAQIAKQNYEEERGFVPALPPIDTVPDLTPYAENGLGVAAFESDTMVGFLCSVSLIDRPFQIPGILGAYSPLHAHGALFQNKVRIYAEMYAAAAEKWVESGASNHAVVLYAHDAEAQQQFFRYGFGLHGVDAIRETNDLRIDHVSDFQYTELLPDEFEDIWPLHNLLLDHFQQSPMFISFPRGTKDEFRHMNEKQKPRYFAAKHGVTVIAYMKLAKRGETFFSGTRDMMNICGAYLLPEYRGKGIYGALLGYTASILLDEGYARLGVDFESINPTAYGFWLKYFDTYTHSVVRRIGEHAAK